MKKNKEEVIKKITVLINKFLHEINYREFSQRELFEYAKLSPELHGYVFIHVFSKGLLEDWPEACEVFMKGRFKYYRMKAHKPIPYLRVEYFYNLYRNKATERARTRYERINQPAVKEDEPIVEQDSPAPIVQHEEKKTKGLWSYIKICLKWIVS